MQEYESLISYQSELEVGETKESLVQRAVEMQEKTGVSYPFCFSVYALNLPD